MRKLSFLSVLIAIAFWGCASKPERATPLAEAADGRSRILFIGDSITYDGRYIAYTEAYLRMHHPRRPFEFINLGLGSETVSGVTEPGHPHPRPNVHQRLEKALAELRPQVVFVCYGMNDGIYHPPSPEREGKYRSGIEQAVDKIKASGATSILLTPPMFDVARANNPQPAGREAYGFNRPYEGYDDVLAGYGRWLMEQEKRRGSHVIDLRGPMVRYVMQRRRSDPTFTLSPDAVHPNEEGHRVMAEQVLRAFVSNLEIRLPADAELVKLILQRQHVMRDAYLTKIGHGHPGVKGGPSVEEAKNRATEIEAEIGKRLEALSAK